MTKIEEIKNQLTDDKESNIAFLREKITKCRADKNSEPALFNELRKMLFENLPEDIQQKYADALGNETKKSNDEIQQALACIHDNNFEEAKIHLNYVTGLMHEVHEKMADATVLNFSGLKEFLIYVGNTKPTKPVEWCSIECAYAYYLLGYIAVEEKNFVEAVNYLDKATEYNPLDTLSLFEKAEICKATGSYIGFDNICNKIYNVLYTPKDLARYYRLLGFYYIEEHKLYLAYSLFLYSLRFEMNNDVINELSYIRNIAPDDEGFAEMPSQVMSILDENNIHQNIPEENIVTLLAITKNEHYKENFGELVNEIISDLDVLINGVKIDDEPETDTKKGGND